MNIVKSLTPEQVIQFLRCRWSLVPEGSGADQLGLYVSGSNTQTDRWLQNQPIGKRWDSKCKSLLNGKSISDYKQYPYTVFIKHIHIIDNP